MCGINGFTFVDKVKIDEMNRTLKHRGPDNLESKVYSTVSLGHARLSIIDLESGDQPMYSVDNKLVIVFNGEIYNYHELRESLIKQGYTFRTRSDTEVILNCYREYGVEKSLNML